MRLRRSCLALLEAGLAIPFLAIAIWAWSGSCAGRPQGYDCESWFILAVNLFGPFGLLALSCSLWGLRSRSVVPHTVFWLAFAAMMMALVIIARR